MHAGKDGVPAVAVQRYRRAGWRRSKSHKLSLARAMRRGYRNGVKFSPPKLPRSVSCFNRVLQGAAAALLLTLHGFAQAPNYAGNYFGLIGEPGSTPLGSVQVVLNRTGHGSVLVRSENETPAGALVSVNAEGTVVASRIIDPRLQLNLSVVAGTGTASNITGTITDSGTAYPVTLVPSATSAGGAAGVYTVAIDTTPATPSTSASLVGVLTAVVSPQGTVRLLGGLADGTLIVQGTTINANGDAEWFLSVPRSHSVGAFKMSFPTTASGTVSGSGTLEDASGVHTVAITGSHFSRAAAFGSSSSWVLNTYGTADAGGMVTVNGVTSPLHYPALLRATGAVPVLLALDVRTGLVAGSYWTLEAGRPVRRLLAGAVFQDWNMTEGFVIQKATVGRFQLTAPNPAPTTVSGATLTITGSSTGGVNLGQITNNFPPMTGNTSGSSPLIINGTSSPISSTGTSTSTTTSTIGTTTSSGTPITLAPLTGTTITPGGIVTPGTLGAAAGTLHLGSAFFSNFATAGFVPPVISLADGTTVVLDVALPAGWSITMDGQPQTGSSFVVKGASGAGSAGTVSFVPAS